MSDATVPAVPPSAEEAPAVPVLPSLVDQAERLVALGLVGAAPGAPSADELLGAADRLGGAASAGSLLVVADAVLPPSALVPGLRRRVGGRAPAEKPGFVVADMPDIDDFAPTPTTVVPDAVVYAATDPDRGDAMRNWSPAEAEASILERGRTPFTVAEGVHWALQAPEVLARNACYMMIGSRLRKAKGFDSRTPALWISNGSGRDGRERRGAPKAGWCWWNNRHTWLGFASGAARVA
ncbi:DUF5701 family protein [Saccharopolyspora griseoalba]|uniref:DUF5701 family protein n=1 Tax=Saccharopolyspora griseoalba TaxID=1431848 RepID=A0ABW2LRL1_9PSEU